MHDLCAHRAHRVLAPPPVNTTGVEVMPTRRDISSGGQCVTAHVTTLLLDQTVRCVPQCDRRHHRYHRNAFAIDRKGVRLSHPQRHTNQTGRKREPATRAAPAAALKVVVQALAVPVALAVKNLDEVIGELLDDPDAGPGGVIPAPRGPRGACAPLGHNHANAYVDRRAGIEIHRDRPSE